MHVSIFVYMNAWIANLQLFIVKGEYRDHLTESRGSVAEGDATGIPMFLLSPAVDC